MSLDRATWRRVLLPTEHGGWAFLLEPILLGALVAPSPAGALLAGVALVAFLSRQSLRVLALDRRTGRRYPRTRAAEIALGCSAVLGLGLTLLALRVTDGRPLPVLVLVAVPAAIALGLDLRLRSREAGAELSEALALAGIAAAMARARGWPIEPALAL